MSTASLSVLRGCKTAIHNISADLTADQMLAVPDGFDNNIAWNIGHIIVASQNIVYGRSSTPMSISDEMVAMYKPGTSPADWSAVPDTKALLTMFMENQQQLEDDFAADIFKGPFETFTSPSSGISFSDLDGALVFDVYHHSQHYGMIMALNNFVSR